MPLVVAPDRLKKAIQKCITIIKDISDNINQYGGEDSCEWRMEAADIREMEVSRAGNLVYVQ